MSLNLRERIIILVYSYDIRSEPFYYGGVEDGEHQFHDCQDENTKQFMSYQSALTVIEQLRRECNPQNSNTVAFDTAKIEIDLNFSVNF